MGKSYTETNESTRHYIFRTIANFVIIYSGFFKFALSSLSAFAIDFSLLLVFNKLFTGLAAEKSLLASVVFARIISSLFNFSVNRHLVFKHKDNLGKELLGYYALVCLILIGNYGFMYLWNILLNLPLPIAKIITEAILFIISYSIQKWFVFKKSTYKLDGIKGSF